MEMYSLFLAVPRKEEVHPRSKTDRGMSNSPRLVRVYERIILPSPFPFCCSEESQYGSEGEMEVSVR